MKARYSIIRILFAALACMSVSAYALSPVDTGSFFKNVSQSPDIQLGVWSGRGDLCMQKAKETGYLMLWFLYYSEDGLEIKRFLQNDLCRQPFCDLINNYKYIILCCENAGHRDVYNRKNEIYGYSANSQILNEATGQYEHNHNGFPAYSNAKKTWCFFTPSLHLLKFDSGSTVLFHISPSGSKMIYETAFSPYASRFPIPQAMCIGSSANNRFAPWLKQYLDMYPVARQIEEYENAGGQAQTRSYDSFVPKDTKQTVNGTNYIYKVVEIAVTETIHPTVYQIAQHRDNLLFRAVTTVRDILVNQRIEDVFSRFDDNITARNFDGKWFVNHDYTMSALSSELSSTASIDIVPSRNCTFVAKQRVGNGFSMSGYEWSVTTNIFQESAVSESGTDITITSTNIDVSVASEPFTGKKFERESLVSEDVIGGKLYRISVGENSTFDVFTTKSGN